MKCSLLICSLPPLSALPAPSYPLCPLFLPTNSHAHSSIKLRARCLQPSTQQSLYPAHMIHYYPCYGCGGSKHKNNVARVIGLRVCDVFNSKQFSCDAVSVVVNGLSREESDCKSYYTSCLRIIIHGFSNV